jgi:hypothetical protein
MHGDSITGLYQLMDGKLPSNQLMFEPIYPANSPQGSEGRH